MKPNFSMFLPSGWDNNFMLQKLEINWIPDSNWVYSI